MLCHYTVILPTIVPAMPLNDAHFGRFSLFLRVLQILQHHEVRKTTHNYS